MTRGDTTDVVTGGHWHGGPEPCPVCGGLAPHFRPHVARHAIGSRAPLELVANTDDEDDE